MSTIKNFYKDATTEKFMFVDEQGGINVVVAGTARLKTDVDKTKLWMYEGREQLGTATITEIAKTAPGVSAVYYSGWDDFVLTNKDFFVKASSAFAGEAVATYADMISLLQKVNNTIFTVSADENKSMSDTTYLYVKQSASLIWVAAQKEIL